MKTPIFDPHQDAKVVSDLAKRNLGPEIFSFARCMVDDVQRAVDAGVSGVVMEVPSSQHLIELGYRWELERAIDLSIESTKYAHDNGLKVVFFPIDFSRSDLKWVIDLIEKVGNEGHMDALALVDTMGATSIHAMPYFVSAVKERINVPLEAHFHQDFGLGIARSYFLFVINSFAFSIRYLIFFRSRIIALLIFTSAFCKSSSLIDMTYFK